jgi:protein gp37
MPRRGARGKREIEMGENTKIEWADHTWNAWVGCSKISPACTNCYAESWAKRSGLVVWGEAGTRRRTSESKWREVHKWNERARATGVRERVFVNSLSDWAEDRRELDAYRSSMFAKIKQCESLDFLLLTKRADKIEGFLPADWGQGYPNVQLGVTAENQEWFDKRVNELWRIKQKYPDVITFVSCEPLLGPIDARWALESVELQDRPIEDGGAIYSEPIDLIIVGGESGSRHSRPMNLAWVRSLQEQCEAAKVPFFFKQWGSYVGGTGPHLGFISLQNGMSAAANKGTHDWGQGYVSQKMSKKRTGRLLDGKEYSQLPR